jgi:predicted N-acetyltransferase YhbS
LASGKDLELNEIGWWSNWATVRWIGGTSYVMRTSDFQEYFFNRAGCIICLSFQDVIPRIESWLSELGRAACFSLQDECRDASTELESLGYVTFDKMSVMQLDSPRFKAATSLTILQGKEVTPADWAATYCLSFYGHARAQEKVSMIARSLGKDSSVTLFAGERHGKVLGVLAAYRTPGLFGVYCIGTLGEHRREGIAGSLILEASKVAWAEGRLLILQTIVSDGVEEYYTKGGFRRLYQKRLMMREATGSNPQSQQGA